MNHSEFEQKMNDLLNAAADIPAPQREKLLFLARRSNENFKVLQEKITTLQGSLDYLRLGIKYMIFDLEATRRENADLRQKIQHFHTPGNPEIEPDNPPKFD